MNKVHEDDEYEYFEEPGAGLAAARALKRSGTMGFSDEAEGALEHYFPRLALTPGDFFDPRVPTPAAKSYTQARDNARAVDDITREAHPYVSGAVELGTALLHPLNKVGGGGLIGAMRGGALQGGIQGLGDSRADLTDGDIENYVRAFGDTARGGGYGAAFGAAGHGVGYLARGLGRKVGGAIDNARESLFREEAERGARELAEADAPRIAQREAEAVARAKEQARMDKEHGQGLEMNKAADRRAAKEAERAAQRAARQPRGEALALTEEPGTRTLAGYRGSAGERRAVNFDRVQAYRERLADPSLSEAERGRLQQYVDSYGDAVDKPGDFERGHIERELRKRYPRDVVDRIMAERVGPDGAIRSRNAAPGMGPEPRTQPMVWDDLKPQGFTADDVVNQFGHGGSAWKGYTPRSEQPTQVALMRTSPDEGIPGMIEEGNVHTFEFRPQGQDGQAYEVVVGYDHANPERLLLDVVKPLDAAGRLSTIHQQAANQVGPAVIKRIMSELGDYFPKARTLIADRVTGWNPDRPIEMRMPGATRAGAPDFSDYEVPYGSPMFRENLAREVEREGLDAPHWQRPREPGERALTPYENAQLEAQNRRMAPDEDTVPQYGYPPEEQFRYQQRLPEDVDFQVGDAAPAERPPVLAPMPARRPAGEGLFDVADKTPRAVHEAPTRGGGGASDGPLPELDPLEVSLNPRRGAAVDPEAPTDLLYPERMEPVTESGAPTFPETATPSGGVPTVAGRRPVAPEPAPPPVMDAAPDKTPVQRPSWMPQAPEPGKVPLYGSKPTDEEIVYKYLGSLESPAMQRAQAREAGAFGELARKGGKAMLDADNPFSAAMRGPWAVTREAIRNPAVRARALSALRLRRLASVDPATWGRVGRDLEQAMQQGPEEYAAAVHVYNQTDPGFREAQRKAAEGLEDMDDARLEQELRAAGLL